MLDLFLSICKVIARSLSCGRWVFVGSVVSIGDGFGMELTRNGVSL